MERKIQAKQISRNTFIISARLFFILLLSYLNALEKHEINLQRINTLAKKDFVEPQEIPEVTMDMIMTYVKCVGKSLFSKKQVLYFGSCNKMFIILYTYQRFIKRYVPEQDLEELISRNLRAYGNYSDDVYSRFMPYVRNKNGYCNRVYNYYAKLLKKSGFKKKTAK